MKRGIKITGDISEWRFATQATPRQFSKKFISEDNLPGGIKLCPSTSVLRAKKHFDAGNRGVTE